MTCDRDGCDADAGRSGACRAHRVMDKYGLATIEAAQRLVALDGHFVQYTMPELLEDVDGLPLGVDPQAGGAMLMLPADDDA